MEYPLIKQSPILKFYESLEFSVIFFPGSGVCFATILLRMFDTKLDDLYLVQLQILDFRAQFRKNGKLL